MWFWNRQELYMGNSMEEYARIKQVLAQNGIRYDMKVSDLSSPTAFSSNRAFGTFGLNHSVLKLYYVYVHKNDYDKAVYLINKKD